MTLRAASVNLEALGMMLVALIVALACAQSPPGPRADAIRAATLDGTTHHRVVSRNVDQVFSIDVWQPIGIPGPHPVVYVLDGNSSFGIAAQTVAPMMFAGEIPPVVVVGVGYQVRSPLDVVALRTRDLTPSNVEGLAERMAADGFPLPAGTEPGGANAFLSFLEEELKPLVAAHHPVDDADETLVGFSLGGTFAAHVLFSSPGSFERYVIGSPALAWDGDRLFADEETYATRSRTLEATVFLSAAEYEVENGILEATQRMSAILERRRYEGLCLVTHVFPEETHESVIPPTISRGLRAVFGAWPREARDMKPGCPDRRGSRAG